MRKSIRKNAGIQKRDVTIRLIGLKEAIEELSVLNQKSEEECKETCHVGCVHEDIRFYLHCAETSFIALSLERNTFKAERDERAEQVRRYDKAIGVLTLERDTLKAALEKNG